MTAEPQEHLRQFWDREAGSGPVGLVWGNCQAESIRRLVAPTAAAEAGVEFIRVPPVHEVTEPELAHLYDLLPDVAALIAQPIRDEYRISGCGTHQIAEALGPGGRVTLFPVVFFEGLFPFQVYARDARDEMVGAPRTDYHDLRVLAAAHRGWAAGRTLDWWSTYRPPAAAVRDIAEGSRAELRRRESELDVTAMAAVDAAGAAAMHTINHPANAVLAEVATDVLGAFGWVGEVRPPSQEMLGNDRTPLEPGVLSALGLTAPATDDWTLAGHSTPVADIVPLQLDWYAEHPEVVARSVQRHERRLTDLRLL